MEEVLVDAENNSSSVTARPSPEQLTTVVEYMLQHPDLASAKLRNGLTREKSKRLWEELTAIVNTVPGSIKSTQGWMRFWVDKKGMVRSKKKMVDEGKHSCILTPLEEKIWKLCLTNDEGETHTRKRRAVKVELDDSDDEVIAKKRKNNRRPSEIAEETSVPDAEERQMIIMEELVQVMNRQASALTQLAQASASNAHAMDKLAEATLTQARAAESIASTFANMGASFHDVRTAIINIDYTMKRCYNINQT